MRDAGAVACFCAAVAGERTAPPCIWPVSGSSVAPACETVGSALEVTRGALVARYWISGWWPEARWLETAWPLLPPPARTRISATTPTATSADAIVTMLRLKRRGVVLTVFWIIDMSGFFLHWTASRSGLDRVLRAREGNLIAPGCSPLSAR